MAFGPFDDDDEQPPAASGRVDFGAVRVPVPAAGSVTVEPTANGRLQAVHVSLPHGRLSFSALAAPKSERLWPNLAVEIDASLRKGGASVRSFQGEWGRELHARTDAATSVFVGVDGARWMLYGVATGPSQHAQALEGELRRMLKDTVVVRGSSPYPVRTVLPLTMPEQLQDRAPDVDVPAPADPPTEPIPMVTPPGGDTGSRWARGGDQPALALLSGDPMSLFAEVRTGRHHRPD